MPKKMTDKPITSAHIQGEKNGMSSTAASRNSEMYFRYPPQRDTVFVLGAGASHPDGVPLQDHILPMILAGEPGEIADSTIGKQITEFVRDNFFVRGKNEDCPKLEAVFGFLDHFIQQDESLSATYDNAAIREIKENLIKTIHYIVDLQTDKRSRTYHLFWEAIHKNNRNVSIITLNYDTLLEQAFDVLFEKNGYIDYCIHLMNYDRMPGLEDYNFWINPREPLVACAAETPAAYKTIKLHGSLNWKYCNCCNQTLLTPWDRKIDLNRGKLVGYTYPDEIEYDYYCPLDGTEFQTLIMPPSYTKTLNNPIISQLFSEASREIRAARKIVFIGYSLSDADVHIKALFRKHLKNDVKVVIVNIKDTQSLQRRYSALSENLQILQCSFEELVQKNDLMESLLGS